MRNSEIMQPRRAGAAGGKSAKSWLRTLPLSDAGAAHHAMSAMLTTLAEATQPARERLGWLETVRAQAAEIDAQFARRHADRPLPLAPGERGAFVQAQAQWRLFAAAYLRCFEDGLADRGLTGAHQALCLQRAATYFAEAHKGHLRAGQAGGEDALEDLQRLVELAAEHGLAETRVRDSLHPKGASSVVLVYQRALLVGLAGALFPAPARDAAFELAVLWESRLALVGAPATWQDAASGAWPATVQAAPRQRLRALGAGRLAHVADVARLSRGLRRRLRLAAADAGFAELRLPESWRALADVGAHLEHLHDLWCADTDAGATARASAGALAEAQGSALAYAAEDFAALFYMVAGAPFGMNQAQAMSSWRRHDELFVFQRASQARVEQQARDAAARFEDWLLLGRDGRLLRLARRRPGARFRAGQLVAVRTDGVVVLAVTRRVAEPGSEAAGPAFGALEVDAELIAADPAAVAVREFAPGRPAGAIWHPGFRLGTPGAAEPLALVLPGGSYRHARLLDVRDGERSYRVSQEALRRRGADFEEIAVTLRVTGAG
ncbi:MAG: hypothetical protein JNM90_03465 [Burkholderiales bacterium]|nr:hypothetical protein [Burkholderiales bacterium]